MTAVAEADPCITTEKIPRGCALIHVDLTGVDTRRRAKAKLEGVTAKAKALCARNPDLRHLVVLLHGCEVAEAEIMPVADRLALSLHQHLETSLGSYVAVTALLNSPPLPPEVLKERLVALTRGARGVDPAVALSTREIVGKDIGDVATGELV